MTRTQHFEPSVTSTRAARTFVLDETDVDELAAEHVALMVSELASNAVLHAQTPYSVTATRVDDVVRVEVRDGSPLLPRMRRYSLDAPTGRGLRMIEKLASRWGIEVGADGSGKVVWFELNLGAAR